MKKVVALFSAIAAIVSLAYSFTVPAVVSDNSAAGVKLKTAMNNYEMTTWCMQEM